MEIFLGSIAFTSIPNFCKKSLSILKTPVLSIVNLYQLPSAKTEFLTVVFF